MHLISKIGGRVRSGRVWRRNASVEFSYDPSSYTLNFEDDTGKGEDQLLVNGFSARLSASSIPTTPLEKKVSRNALDEILENEEEFAVMYYTAHRNIGPKEHRSKGKSMSNEHGKVKPTASRSPWLSRVLSTIKSSISS